MNPILHLQTRAYPTYHRGLASGVSTIQVPDVGRLAVRHGALESLAYHSQPTLELDVSELFRHADHVEGTQVVWARLRVLSPAAVLLTTAFEHDRDLAALDVYQLCNLDARVNQKRREIDAPVTAAILDALFDAGALDDPHPRMGWGNLHGQPLSMWPAVRYNAHFLTPAPQWESDPRVKCGPLPACSILVPYTYEWSGQDPMDVDSIMGLLEPTDVVIAQRSVLAGAMEESIAILEEISSPTATALPPMQQLRRHIDRIRSSYHRLDAYRFDSSQDSRAVYISARQEMALDEIHERTESVMAKVSDSIQAEVSERTMALDGKLNRLAAIFTVATGGALVLDVVQFIGGGHPPPVPWRTILVAFLFLLGVLTVVVLLLRSNPDRALRA